jgi:putative endonuclease
MQEYDNIGEAYAMERKIHGWGRAKREALIRGDFETIHQLSRRGHRTDPEGASG